jgi:hypothetical protein
MPDLDASRAVKAFRKALRRSERLNAALLNGRMSAAKVYVEDIACKQSPGIDREAAYKEALQEPDFYKFRDALERLLHEREVSWWRWRCW